MDIRKLQRAIVDGLEDVKAHNIVVFNTEHLSPLFERVIIASGTSNRQTKSLASSVRDTVKGRGLPVLRTEGEANGEWIIVDCGAAVVVRAFCQGCPVGTQHSSSSANSSSACRASARCALCTGSKLPPNSERASA